MKNHLLLTILIFTTSWSLAQESNEFKPQIRGAIMMANSHIPKATEGGKKIAVIPTWGFDVDYFFHSRWSVAIQGDIKLSSFEVEDEQAILERTNPFALAAVIHYHALRHWSFYTGPGYEFEPHKGLYLFKLGTEYSFEINEQFEIALNLMFINKFINKQEIYDEWMFGIAFNRRLWVRK